MARTEKNPNDVECCMECYDYRWDLSPNYAYCGILKKDIPFRTGQSSITGTAIGCPLKPADKKVQGVPKVPDVPNVPKAKRNPIIDRIMQIKL